MCARGAHIPHLMHETLGWRIEHVEKECSRRRITEEQLVDFTVRLVEAGHVETPFQSDEPDRNRGLEGQERDKSRPER